MALVEELIPQDHRERTVDGVVAHWANTFRIISIPIITIFLFKTKNQLYTQISILKRTY